MGSDPITHYVHTHHRIVLLIDATPLHHNPDYTKRIVSFLETLLSFPPLSTSLFAFKLFLSSLSPLLSTSKLHPFIPQSSLSFNNPSHTLQHLSHTLSSLPSFHPLPTPNASCLAQHLSQLLHDHSWELSDANLPANLVLLFSPSFVSSTSLASFLHTGGNLVADLSSFVESFSSFFSNVSRAFDSRGIRCCWISVDCEIGSETESVIESDEVREVRRLIDSGVERLGWGFCSLDSVLLASALVPFGLIYPKIGGSWNSLCSSRDSNGNVNVNARAQLSLRILDVNGSPIEYNCCDLEFVDMKNNLELLGNSQGGGCVRKKMFWELCMEGNVKLEVKIVRRCDAFIQFGEWLCDSVLVLEVFGGLKKKEKSGLDEFLADRVLELVANEFGCDWRRKAVPVWEMLLSFLYREGCWASVSVTNDKGGSCVGVLRPFTVFTALLSVLGDPYEACCFDETNVEHVRMVDDEICQSDFKFNKEEDLSNSQGKKSAVAIEGQQRKKKMMDLKTLTSLKWSSFCTLVYDQFETDLFEVYYAMEGNKSKKLKFLKCWMKQMKKSVCADLTLFEKPKLNLLIAEEGNSKVNDLPKNSEQPISSFGSVDINPELEASRIQKNAELDFRSETSETFFSNLADRINRGIESESVDLGALAERLVNSSIYLLRQKIDRQTISQSQSPSEDLNACGSTVAFELIKLLLRKPKEIAVKHKSQDQLSQSQAFDSAPAKPITEHTVREYELQILFRMEILQSEVGSEVRDSCKQKFVKQICLFLENIQCHMEEGFFDVWTLENYVTKIIKNRYSHSLEDVVQKIYNKMDLELFADEDEDPNSLLNSEDSNKSLNKKVYRDEVGENDAGDQPISAENEPFQLQKDGSGRYQRSVDVDHDKKLIEAKKRRERARRFSSFTTWMPVLQKVWAPKQKCVKPKTDQLQRMPKRKERERVNYGTVSETPMTGYKRSIPRSRDSDDENGLVGGSQPSGSVSKALFKDDL